MKLLRLIVSILFAGVLMSQSLAQVDLKKLNRFVQDNKQDDKSAQAFRLGRDFIEDGKWAAAEKTFLDYLRDYPQHKNADAALYWLAFSNKKQAHYEAAEKYLRQLLSQYPQSNWRNDAQALWLEIAPTVNSTSRPAIGRTDRVVRASSASQSPVAIGPGISTSIPPAAPIAVQSEVVGVAIASDELLAPLAVLEAQPHSLHNLSAAAAAVGDANSVGRAYGGFPAASGRNEPVNEQDELKGIALQSLMQSDPDRALNYVADILKSDKSSKYMKDTAIRLLGQYNGPKTTPYLIDFARGQYDVKLRRNAIFWLGQNKDDKVSAVLEELVTKSEDTEIAKAALFALAQRRDARSRQFLYGIASGGQHKLLQNDAILRLGMWGDDAAVDDLLKIYEASTELEVKKRVLRSLSQQSNPRASAKLVEIARSNSADELRLQAVRELCFHSDESTMGELLKLYDDEKSDSVRKQILLGLSQSRNPKAKAKIRDIALNDKNIGVRLQAIFWLGQNGEDNINELTKLYDADANEQVKTQVLFALSQSKAKAALQKLMQIAKSDPSINLRKKAVTYIGRSQDPEAAKFLEELLK